MSIRRLIWVVMVMLLLVPRGMAQELLLGATVEASYEVALTAPHSGQVMPHTLRVGDKLSAGEVALRLAPQAVYAQVTGSVAAVFAADGDSASGAVSRYGAVVMLDYEDRYQLIVDVRTGHNSPENRDPRVGTTVYLRSLNGRHTAGGEVVGAEGGRFTLAVKGGDLVFGEEVRVYANADYAQTSLLGRAKPETLAPLAVSAQGTVVRMAVQQGQRVAQGDLLFTYVPETPAPEHRQDPGAVRAAEDMVVASVTAGPGTQVQQRQILATAWPLSAMQLVAQAEQRDLARLMVGSPVRIIFEELGIAPIEGKVSGQSHLSLAADPPKFEIYVAFDAPEQVRFGMFALIEVP